MHPDGSLPEIPQSRPLSCLLSCRMRQNLRMTRSNRLLIRHSTEASWRAPLTQAYSDEAELQLLLQQSPQLLVPDHEGGSPMAVARELYVPETGPLDLVGVTLEGDITVVECKLRTNPEIRRHVVGQLFAYASGLWRMDYETFDKAFSDRAGMSLAAAMATQVHDGHDFNEEGFRARVATRLASGRFRIVIAVDQITEELRRIIEYLNELTLADVAVYALELRYLADGDVQILIPVSYGTEFAQSKSNRAAEKVTYDWSSYQRLGIPDDRIAVGQKIVQALEQAVADRQISAEFRFNKGYVALFVPGAGKTAVVDMYYTAFPRFAVRLPDRPEALGVSDPYHNRYRVTWGTGDNEWGWTIPTLADVPDVGVALDIALEHSGVAGGAS